MFGIVWPGWTFVANLSNCRFSAAWFAQTHQCFSCQDYDSVPIQCFIIFEYTRGINMQQDAAESEVVQHRWSKTYSSERRWSYGNCDCFLSNGRRGFKACFARRIKVTLKRMEIKKCIEDTFYIVLFSESIFFQWQDITWKGADTALELLLITLRLYNLIFDDS